MSRSWTRHPSGISAPGLLMGLTLLGAVSGAAVEPPGEESAAVTASEVLTLDQAVTLALEENPDLKIAALEVVKASSELGSFRTKRLPTFNIYAIESKTLDEIKVHVPAGA